MTGENAAAPESAITARLLADAEEQAKRIIENAERSAAAEERKTHKEIEEIERDSRADLDARIEKIHMREVSTAKIESRRILLDAREQAVARMFADIEQGLARLREDPGTYRRSLRKLAAEAAAAIGGDEVVLKFSERDRGLVDDAFLRDLEALLGDAGAGVKFRVEFTDDDGGGGCTAASPDGRVVYDNTLRRRLERMRPEIRAMIVAELAGDEG